MDFAFLEDHRVKSKESYLTREFKKRRNMKAPEMPVVIGALGAVSNAVEKRLTRLEIRREIETIQTKILLRSTCIHRRDLKKIYCHPDNAKRNS